MNFLNSNSAQYTQVYGWSWDGKDRGGEIIARRVKGTWIITCADFYMQCDRIKGAKKVEEQVLVLTKKTARISIGGKQFMLPEGCLKDVVIDNVLAKMVMIPCFIDVKVNHQMRTIVGCFAQDETKQYCALFSIKPEDPMLHELDYTMIHVKDSLISLGSTKDPSMSFAPFQASEIMAQKDSAEDEVHNDLERIVSEIFTSVEDRNTAVSKILREHVSTTPDKRDLYMESLEKKEYDPKTNTFVVTERQPGPGELITLKKVETVERMNEKNRDLYKDVEFNIVNGRKIICLDNWKMSIAKDVDPDPKRKSLNARFYEEEFKQMDKKNDKMQDTWTDYEEPENVWKIKGMNDRGSRIYKGYGNRFALQEQGKEGFIPSSPTYRGENQEKEMEEGRYAPESPSYSPEENLQ